MEAVKAGDARVKEIVARLTAKDDARACALADKIIDVSPQELHEHDEQADKKRHQKQR